MRSSRFRGSITSVTVKGGRSRKNESRIPRVYHTPRGVCQPPVPYTRMRGKKEESAMARSELRSRARGTPINVERAAGLGVYPPAVGTGRVHTRLIPSASRMVYTGRARRPGSALRRRRGERDALALRARILRDASPTPDLRRRLGCATLGVLAAQHDASLVAGPGRNPASRQVQRRGHASGQSEATRAAGESGRATQDGSRRDAQTEQVRTAPVVQGPVHDVPDRQREPEYGQQRRSRSCPTRGQSGSRDDGS